MKYLNLLIAFSLVSLIGCNKQAVQPSIEDFSEYDRWQEERIKKLKEPLGYLSMVGLYWFEEGENTFGSSRKNNLIFPEGMPDTAGIFLMENDQVQLILPENSKIDVNGSYTDSIILQSDAFGAPSMIHYESFFFYLIQRGDRIGLRVKDTLADSRLNFKYIPRFKVDTSWVVDAEFIPAGFQSTIPITNAVGITTRSKLAGILKFEYKGTTHILKALDGGANQFFVVFGDQTNEDETYGGGRFLYVNKPDAEGKTKIDFNRAENPICAFNDYATCPLPPDGNILNFRVEAGERIYAK